MSHSQQETITRLLEAVRKGDRSALNALFPKVYDALHGMAKQQRFRWHGDNTVNTTALVHEAYLKMADQSRADWTSRAHFYAVAARAMRNILIDYARQRRAQKRGGDVQKVSLETHNAILMSDAQADRMVTLERLAHTSPRQARVAECKFFSMMTNEDTAAALGVSKGTVKRNWMLAKAWLHREIQEALEPLHEKGEVA